MKILKYLGIGALVMLSACGSKPKGESAQTEYDKTLSDSIAAIQQEIDSCDSQAAVLRDQVGEWLRDFSTVANPREAGSYVILSSYRNRYPLTSTGLVARINDSGQFELIGALSVSSFNQVTVDAPSESATSDVVPRDQALNYHTASLTTVLFTGEKADAIGRLIADNQLNPLTVTFMESKPVKSWKIPESNAKMIAYTYQLYSSQKELNRLERRVPMLHEKINILRIHKDKNK